MQNAVKASLQTLFDALLERPRSGLPEQDKKVDPEPDIPAARTSGCLNSQCFMAAKTINFSKTGRSSALKILNPAKVLLCLEPSGAGRAAAQAL